MNSFSVIINDIIGYIDIYVYPTSRLIQTQWVNSSDIAGEISLLMDSHQRGVVFSIVLSESFAAGNFYFSFYFSEFFFKLKKPCNLFNYKALGWWALKDSAKGIPSEEPTTPCFTL